MLLRLFLLINCFVALNLVAKQPLIYGDSFEHQSKLFNEKRRYMVSLPESYQITQRSYPTLYVIDGDFQFHHVANTARHLARMGKIPPMIVIGIANQGSRDYLLSNTWPIKGEEEYGKIEKFSEYIKVELIPTIESNYRTNSKKAIAGYSLGGLFVMYSYIDKNSPFNAFLAMSPSVWFDDYGFKERFNQYLKHHPKESKPLFISLASEQGMGVDGVVNVLKKRAAKNLRWQYKHYPNETHYTTALPALYDGLVFLAPNYFTDLGELLDIGDYQAVWRHFAKKKELWSGFQFEWLQSYTLGKYMFASKQQDKMNEALKNAKILFPQSINELSLNFALALNKNKMPQKAFELLKEIETENQNSAKWHYQMSLALESLGKNVSAKKHHATALDLARKQNLESWEYWELEPYKQ
ncbi:alpha/beta hydrolase [Aliikangiella sp. IMCC44359]|uniref:alpha/beta hydrolase n=1 Tax=Aliikangiella sp. IMCC44359 TaxID=3459125 RepID=UPI00403B2951